MQSQPAINANPFNLVFSKKYFLDGYRLTHAQFVSSWSRKFSEKGLGLDFFEDRHFIKSFNAMMLCDNG